MRPLLRLRAEEAADIEVIAAAVQDSLLQAGDIQYDPRRRRVSLILSRFRWEHADEGEPYERIRAALSFEGVLELKSHRFRRDAPDAIADLLSIRFDPDAEPPGGQIRLILAGGGELALTVEALDVTLVDLGPSWATPRRPDHERA
jgi:Protein of unknown function (DUF2948)